MSSWHANFLKPGAAAQALHSDLALPNPLPNWIARVNVNFILEDYNLENGATQCVPGSNLFFKQPNEHDTAKFEKSMKTLTARKGSLVIWTGHLWHRSGQNNSTNTRVAALACYAASFLLELALEENHPLVISDKRKAEMPAEITRLFALKHGIK
jgi:ectoine hydroxylase-related dioxygenase (phytanoyl-CoA dioxygenase family)